MARILFTFRLPRSPGAHNFDSMPSLFLYPDRHNEWRALLQQNEPTASAIIARMRDMADHPNPDACNGPDALLDERASASAALTLAWLEQDADRAESARRRIEAHLDAPPKSDLGKAAQSLTAVLAWEFGKDLWSEAHRRAFADRLARIAHSFLEVTNGNPHVVTNNWWMLTHGGCLLACMAADTEQGTNGTIDLEDLKHWALARFKAFCGHFGTAGLYHEGSGYINYTLSMLMPALLAVSRSLDPDILDQFPQLRRSIPSILVGTASFRHIDSGGQNESFGSSLQWNDAGRGCIGLNPFLPGLALAPPAWRGALRTVFDRLHGIKGANTWTCSQQGFPMAVALYPFSTTPENPESVLPKYVFDQRHGLGLWRSHWGRGDETVLGWYARSVAPGGHRQDDAASIRLIARGRTWICAGGQARSKALWQSVFTHADEDMRPRPAPLAFLSASHVSDSGGVIAIDTRQSLGSYSERYMAWQTSSPDSTNLAILDLLDDARNPPLDWQWNLSFPRELQTAIHQDARGFTAIDPEKGCLTGRFLLDLPDSLQFLQMPPSRRSFSNGRTVDYPGDQFLHASFASRAKARILVALRIDKEPVQASLAGNTLRFGQSSWPNPFAPVILPSVNLQSAPPNFMTHPAG